MIAMVVGGGLMGFAYIKLLQAGYNPSQWIYSIYGIMERSVTPGQNIKNKSNRIKFEPSQNNTQQRVDDLLDKINQKGYKSLSKEERDFLTNAGK
jgi:hypothetical protein